MAAAIAVDDVVDDEDGRGIGGRGVIGAVGEIEDDAVAVGVVGGGVEFAGDDVVGDDVVEAGVGIEPLVGVVGDAAGPAVPLGVGSGGRHVAVVVDEVVVGGEVVAVAGADAGGAGIAHGIVDKAEVVGALAPESVAGIAVAIEVEAAELDIGDAASGERAAAEAEDGGSVGGAGIDDVDGAVAVVFVGDPGGGSAARGGSEGGGEVVGTAQEAEDGAGLGGVGSALKSLGGRSGSAGIGVIAGRGGEQRAVGSARAVADRDIQDRTDGEKAGGIGRLGGQGVRTVRERSGIEAVRPVCRTGGI